MLAIYLEAARTIVNSPLLLIPVSFVALTGFAEGVARIARRVVVLRGRSEEQIQRTDALAFLLCVFLVLLVLQMTILVTMLVIFFLG